VGTGQVWVLTDHINGQLEKYAMQYRGRVEVLLSEVEAQARFDVHGGGESPLTFKTIIFCV
jgi:hypothetical protein